MFSALDALYNTHLMARFIDTNLSLTQPETASSSGKNNLVPGVRNEKKLVPGERVSQRYLVPRERYEKIILQSKG